MSTNNDEAPVRVGLIVPSSNVTVETELPALLNRHRTARFTFHSSRMRMHTVSDEELKAMNEQRERCVAEITDAQCNALVYACLIALMAQGPGEHIRAETAVSQQLVELSREGIVTSSAGALVEALHALNAKRIALVTPYIRPLAERVVSYLEAEGFTVTDWVALEVADNAAVGRIAGEHLLAAARQLNLAETDTLIISACVQMPSLELIPTAEQEFGLPVISAATATAYTLLRRLGLPTVLSEAGCLLSNEH
jgi:maleate isomerase